MTSPVVVLGAGGFGREVLDVIDAVNLASVRDGAAPLWGLLGVVDDAPSDINLGRLQARSVRHLGSLDDVLLTVGAGVHYVVGIGSPAVRRRLATACDAARLVAATLIHPDATVGSMTVVGAGTVVCAGVRISTNVSLGRHVHLNANATVGHDSVIGDHVSLNPLAAVSGDCVIGDGVLVGVAGVVLNGLRVGRDAVIGGSACVVTHVEPGATVIGVPARQLAAREA